MLETSEAMEPMVVEATEPAATEPMEDKMPCPGCGKVLRVRTLAEKHTCARKPRKSWKMDPDRPQARRRAAAERRFLASHGGEAVEIRGGH